LDLGARSRPERLRAIDRLVHAALRRHLHGERDVVRILADQCAQAASVLELGGVGLELQLHRRAALLSLDRLDAVLALPSRYPPHPFRRRRIGAAREHRDLVRDDERRVETDAELPDELGVLALITAEPLEELAGARARDRAEILDHLVAAHADTVVA